MQSEAPIPELEWAEAAEPAGLVEPAATPRAPSPGIFWPSAIVVVAVIGCSLWANLSALVTNRADYRFFPPFERGVNRNNNEHLAAEYYSIAKALVAGRGFADPFHEQTGPTAWMPPVLSWVLAALYWAAGGDTEIVTALFVLLQDLTLIGTGLLLVLFAHRTTGHVWPVTFAYVGALAYYFRHCFQFTHDCWIILAALDLLIAGMVWLRPLESSRKRAVLWGVFGGLCALISPIVGFTWGVLALSSGWRKGRRSRLVLAALVSMLTITPWVIRNYLVFGRFIPVKSNLVYELWQSQCTQRDGLLRSFAGHPYATDGEERWEYRRDGEMKFLDRRGQLFRESVAADPMSFVDRVVNRFFAATLEYVAFSHQESRRPWMTWFSQVVYPLPFLALLVLLVTIPWRPLDREQWIVIGVYVAYLTPYVMVSFYDRYKFPLMAAEVILVVWAVDRIYRCWLRPSVEDDEVYAVVELADEN